MHFYRREIVLGKIWDINTRKMNVQKKVCEIGGICQFISSLLNRAADFAWEHLSQIVEGY